MTSVVRNNKDIVVAGKEEFMNVDAIPPQQNRVYRVRDALEDGSVD